jgi:hypothetical protein
MGRYYEGDINGKFMFGVQDSDASERFGGTEIENNYTTYYFDEDDLEDIETELNSIEKNFGDSIDKIEEFFDQKGSFTTEKLAEFLCKSKEEAHLCLEEYADYKMGKEIRDCVKLNGQCEFTAEH